MPGTPPITTNFGAPRFADSDTVAFSAQVNSATDFWDVLLASVAHRPGDLIMSAATTRAGCLLCNGDTTQDASSFPALASVIGSGSSGVYGSAAAGKLHLPDFRGRVIVGAGTGPGLTSRALGASSGEENHGLAQQELPNYNLFVSDPGHSHLIDRTSVGPTGEQSPHTGSMFGLSPGTGTPYTYTENGVTNVTVNSQGGNVAHNNMQPFGTANVFIKT